MRPLEAELGGTEPLVQEAQQLGEAQALLEGDEDLADVVLVVRVVGGADRAEHLEGVDEHGGVGKRVHALRPAVTKSDDARGHRQRPPVRAAVVVLDDVPRAQAVGRAILLEQADEGEVRGRPFGVHPGGHHVAAPDVEPVALARLVALGLGQRGEERVGRRALAELVEKIEGAGGVAQALHGLEAGEVPEEPGARRVHEQGVTLLLEQGERLDAVAAVAHVLGDEVVDGAGTEHDVGVGVACRPRVVEDGRAATFEHLDTGVAQQVERVAQRPAPPLIGAGRAAGRAPAVVTPAADAVGAGPGALTHLDLPRGRMLVEEAGDVGDGQVFLAGDHGEGVGEGALGEVVVVAEGLPVGGDGGDTVGRDRRGQALDQTLGGHGAQAEGEVVRRGAVVEDEVDRARPVGGVDPAVGAMHVDGAGADVVPLGVVLGLEGADCGRLVGRQDGEAHALFGEHAQHVVVHRGLGEPDALGVAAEAVAEVGEAPAHLRARVALVGEGEDQVVVGLGDRAAAEPVALDHAGEDLGLVGVEPGEQGGADVEAQVGVVVDDGHDPAPVVDDAGPAVGAVALRRDALVPVVVRRRRRLRRHQLRPGVLPRRLVEVPVHDE